MAVACSQSLQKEVLMLRVLVMVTNHLRFSADKKGQKPLTAKQLQSTWTLQADTGTSCQQQYHYWKYPTCCHQLITPPFKKFSLYIHKQKKLKLTNKPWKAQVSNPQACVFFCAKGKSPCLCLKLSAIPTLLKKRDDTFTFRKAPGSSRWSLSQLNSPTITENRSVSGLRWILSWEDLWMHFSSLQRIPYLLLGERKQLSNLEAVNLWGKYLTCSLCSSKCDNRKNLYQI